MPQTGQVSWVAGLPFFMVMDLGLFISLLALRFTQYAYISFPPLWLCEINLVYVFLNVNTLKYERFYLEIGSLVYYYRYPTTRAVSVTGSIKTKRGAHCSPPSVILLPMQEYVFTNRIAWPNTGVTTS